MREKLKYLKGVLTICVMWISNKSGLLFSALLLLTILMIADYVSGMLAAKKESLQYPYNPKYGWSSKASIIGIYQTGWLYSYHFCSYQHRLLNI